MIAIILGSGLSDLIDYVEVEKTITYDDISDFDIISLEGHERIIYEANIDGAPMIILSGKLHLYEGYTYEQSIAPLKHVSNNYEITKWIITSASGGLTSKAIVGDWQEVSSVFTLENILGLYGSTKSIILPSEGLTYAYQKGPALGTVAEYKMLAQFGADLVGMSMLPELIYLKSIDENLSLYSLPVCNYHPIDYDIDEPSHAQVIHIANRAIPNLVTILTSIITAP